MRSEYIKSQFISSHPSHPFTSEFNYGNTRADLVSMVDDEIFTYEIKSEGDSFSRLSNQLFDYLEYSNYVYVIVPVSKLRSTISYLSTHHFPSVGIFYYIETSNGISFFEHKKSSLSSSLWNPKKALMKIPRYFLYKQLNTSNYTQSELTNMYSTSELLPIWKKYLTSKLISKTLVV